MSSPWKWSSPFETEFNHTFNDDTGEVDLVAQTQRKMQQDMKRNNWEMELEKIRQQFMSSTPFKTNLTRDRINTYDGDIGRQELQEAKTKVLSDFSNANFKKDTTSDNLFKVEFDVFEFDPETVKVRLEDDTLVVEAKQVLVGDNSHTSKREFYRKVVLPSGANSDRMLCNLSAQGLLTVKIPAPPSYSEAFKDSKKSMENVDEDTSPSKTEYHPGTMEQTDTITGHTPVSREYTSAISSGPTRHVIRTKEYVPSKRISRSYSEFTPSRLYTPSSTTYEPSTIRYTTTQYSPGRTGFTTTTKRFSPSTISKEYKPGISSKKSTFTEYSPTKYSTLPSRPRQKSGRVYLGRSQSNTIDPKWRSREHKMSFCDSVDSEATLSSSPSDDLYYGHSSFSDLDI